LLAQSAELGLVSIAFGHCSYLLSVPKFIRRTTEGYPFGLPVYLFG